MSLIVPLLITPFRSPNPAFDVNRGSVGGWGLNVDGIGKDAEDEYEDMDDFDDSLNGTPGAMNSSELDKTIVSAFQSWSTNNRLIGQLSARTELCRIEN